MTTDGYYVEFEFIDDIFIAKITYEPYETGNFCFDIIDFRIGKLKSKIGLIKLNLYILT